jgi:hypothetical protein
MNRCRRACCAPPPLAIPAPIESAPLPTSCSHSIWHCRHIIVSLTCPLLCTPHHHRVRDWLPAASAVVCLRSRRLCFLRRRRARLHCHLESRSSTTYSVNAFDYEASPLNVPIIKTHFRFVIGNEPVRCALQLNIKAFAHAQGVTFSSDDMTRSSNSKMKRCGSCRYILPEWSQNQENG